jgi:hypothetical protein
MHLRAEAEAPTLTAQATLDGRSAVSDWAKVFCDADCRSTSATAD